MEEVQELVLTVRNRSLPSHVCVYSLFLSVSLFIHLSISHLSLHLTGCLSSSVSFYSILHLFICVWLFTSVSLFIHSSLMFHLSVFCIHVYFSVHCVYICPWIFVSVLLSVVHLLPHIHPSLRQSSLDKLLLMKLVWRLFQHEPPAFIIRLFSLEEGLEQLTDFL